MRAINENTVWLRLLRMAGLALLAAAVTWLAVAARAPATAAESAHAVAAPGEPPELAYLKQVNAWRPPSDPQLLFLLMAQFANAGRAMEGVAWFEDALRRFDPVLSPVQRGLYLTALASLRANAAQDVFVLKRPGWVRETVALLDQAGRLTGGQVFVQRWMSAIVRAQLPAFFGEREHALADLRWCEANADKAPHAGWLREVRIFERRLTQGGAADPTAPAAEPDHSPALFTTPYSEDTAEGHTFAPRSIREVVPGTVYLLSGFEFTDYAFVISADRRELIAVDAGTRPDAAREALAALRARVGDLPPLTTVFITHAHWDHVGGRKAFSTLQPPPRFIGRANYADELAVDASVAPAGLRRLFGTAFDPDGVLTYRPDATIDRPTTLTIGGTRFDLVPARGGETRDAMLVHLPQYGVLFAGDVLMPYLGAPFAEEGSLDGLLDAIEQVHALAPSVLLHGHAPLTQLFNSTTMLDQLHPHLVWLRAEVGRALRAGLERGAIHASNPMPPDLSASGADVHLAYLVMRENVINRLVDQQTGYWQNGLQGLDVLAARDYGAALVDYLEVDEEKIAAAAERMIRDGRHELAATMLRWAEPRFPSSARIAAVKRLAYLRLMEKAQATDPFKFALYASEIGQLAPQMGAHRAD